MDQQENQPYSNQFNGPVNEPARGTPASGRSDGDFTDPNLIDPNFNNSEFDESLSLAERAVQRTRTQASEAAQSFRRGEIVQHSIVDPTATNDDRLIAMLSYITQLLVPLAMPIIILISESGKRRPFQRYHAVQSLALSLLIIGLVTAASISLGLLQIVPVVGAVLLIVSLCLSPIAMLIGLATIIYYGVQAYRGRRFAIPGLTSFLRDQGWLT